MDPLVKPSTSMNVPEDASAHAGQGQAESAHEPSAAVGGTLQLAQELGHVLGVGRVVTGVTGRVDAGPAAEGRHLKARVVGQNGLPAAQCLEHRLRLELGVRGEGRAGLLGKADPLAATAGLRRLRPRGG